MMSSRWPPAPAQILDDLDTIALAVECDDRDDDVVTKVLGPLERLFGLESEALLGPLSSWLSRIRPTDGSGNENLVPSAVGESTEFECQIRSAGGVHLRCRHTARRHDDHIAILVTVLHDQPGLSAPSEVSQELELVEKRYQAVFEASLDPLLLLDPNGNIVEVSRAVEDIVGWSPTEALDHHFTDFVSEESIPDAVELWERIIGGESVRAHLDVQHRDNVTVPAEISATSVDLDGSRHVVIVLRDLRENVEMRTALQKIEQRLARTEKLQLVGELAGGIAHDIHNMLAVMTGSAQMIVRDAPTPTLRADAEAIVAAGRTAAELSRRLLALGSRSSQTERVRLDEALDHLEPLFERMLPDGIDLTTHVAPGLPAVAMDSGAFEQVLLNLVINARDAIDEGGKIELSARQTSLPSHGIQLEVSDDGCGIPPEVVDHIFEPLYTTKGDDGTGLGLSTVARIIDKVGGSRQVHSEVGEGTRFILHLPATDEATETLGSQPTEVTQIGKSLRALVVDDTPNALRYLERALQSHGFSVRTADSVDAALEHLADHDELDVVVTDFHMPNGSGVELLERTQQIAPNLPVIFVTADQFFDAPDEASATLRKPFSPSELLEMILVALED